MSAEYPDGIRILMSYSDPAACIFAFFRISFFIEDKEHSEFLKIRAALLFASVPFRVKSCMSVTVEPGFTFSPCSPNNCSAFVILYSSPSGSVTTARMFSFSVVSVSSARTSDVRPMSMHRANRIASTDSTHVRLISVFLLPTVVIL